MGTSTYVWLSPSKLGKGTDPPPTPRSHPEGSLLGCDGLPIARERPRSLPAPGSHPCLGPSCLQGAVTNPNDDRRTITVTTDETWGVEMVFENFLTAVILSLLVFNL
jgi:hypothetical protein